MHPERCKISLSVCSFLFAKQPVNGVDLSYTIMQRWRVIVQCQQVFSEK